MSGRLALSLSPEWRSLYFPVPDRIEVERFIPDGHILGVSALSRRAWKVWLMTDDIRPQDRRVVWKFDRITNTGGKEACLFALRKHAPVTTVTVDDEGYVRSIDPFNLTSSDGGHNDR